MTLFAGDDVVADVIGLPGRESPQLPQPTAGRWKPLRLGLIDLWQYDDARFRFDGLGLLLHGRNMSGKTKVLEASLPLLLQGNFHPRNLDPFGATVKKMRWNVLDWRRKAGDDRKNATSYAFLECGRVDEDGSARFFTTGFGYRATDSTEGSWLWTVRDRRMDADLFLCGDDRVPLSERNLRELEGVVVHPDRRAFQEAVRSTLFPGMSPRRFEAMLEVLVSLRRPQLTATVNLDFLQNALAEALPPPDRDKVDGLLGQFDRLDALRQEADGYRQQARHLDRFVDTYRAHARRAVADTAAAFTAANTQFDNVTRARREAERTLEGAAKALSELEELYAAAEERKEGIDRSLLALDRRALETVTQVKNTADLADEQASHARQQAEGAAGRAARSQADLRDREEEVDHEGRGLADQVDSTNRALQGVGVPDRIDLPRGRADAERIVTMIRALVAEVTLILQQALATLAALNIAASAERNAVDEHEAAERRAEATATADRVATEEADDALERWAADVADWVRRLSAACSPAAEPADAVSEVDAAAEAVAEGTDPTAALVGLFAAARTAHAVARSQHHDDASQAHLAARGLRDEADRLEQTTENPPPARAGVPTVRVGAPLWDVVDFRTHLRLWDRAGLEAALDAAGLLDAAVDAGTLAPEDTRLGATPAVPAGAATLATVLVALPDAPATTAAALATVAVVDPAVDPGEDVLHWVSADGRWRNGPLSGQWSKPAAEYVGAAARRAANRARATAIRVDADRIDAEAVDHERAAEAAAAALEGLDEPPPPAKTALTRLAAAGQARAAAADASGDAERRRTARQAAQYARRNAEAAADAALLPFGIDHGDCACEQILETRRNDLSALRHHAAGLPDSAGRVERHRERLALAHAALAADAAQADTATSEARRLARIAAGAQRAWEEAHAALGEEAAYVEMRISELTTAQGRADVDLHQLRARQVRASGEKGKAEKALETASEAQAEQEGVRADRLVKLNRLRDRSPLWGLAVGPQELDVDTLNVTQARQLAASVTTRLRNQPTADRKQVFGAWERLKKDLPDLDPILDADTLEVSVAVEGGYQDIADRAIRVTALASQAAKDLTDEESDLIESRVVNDLADHLAGRIREATDDVYALNQTLARRRQRRLQTLELHWRPNANLDPADQHAITLLTRRGLDGADREARNRFLVATVKAARAETAVSDPGERVHQALDYRRLHHFRINLVEPDGTTARFDKASHATGSGGSKARLIHLALFATIASYYDSVRIAPRLVALDEAFEGCDDQLAADIMGLAAELDLDLVLSTYSRWCTFRTVPALAIYDLYRDDTVPGVTAFAYRWAATADQRERAEPWDT